MPEGFDHALELGLDLRVVPAREIDAKRDMNGTPSYPTGSSSHRSRGDETLIFAVRLRVFESPHVDSYNVRAGLCRGPWQWLKARPCDSLGEAPGEGPENE